MKLITIITSILGLFIILTLGVGEVKATVSCQANQENPPGSSDLGNPGIIWKANCERSCSQQPPPNSVCPWSTDSYVLNKHKADTTAWCFGFDEGSRCMQAVVKSPPEGTISCDGKPNCNFSGVANPQVALNVSWKGLKECWDLGGAGTTCNYVGADLCVKQDDNSWKLVASGGSDPNGKTAFPDGALPRVPPSGGLDWIQSGYNYTFALFEDAYTASKQACSDGKKENSSDPDCLDHQYSTRGCKGKKVPGSEIQVTTTKSSTTGGSSPNALSCSISGPASAARNSKASYKATKGNNNVKWMEIYYIPSGNLDDKNAWNAQGITSCDATTADDCIREIDTSTVPADKEQFVVACNAYSWKPTITAKNNCTAGTTDVTHCKPDGESLSACTGNPLWYPNLPAGWENTMWNSGSCGAKSFINTVKITAPAATTTSYRIAENPTDLAAADWQDYTADGMTINRVFTDKNPGIKTLFVEFKDSAGKTGGCGVNNTQPCQVQIKILGSDPIVTSCVLGFEGNNAIVNLKGSNFGSDKGKVTSNDKDLAVREWKNDSIKVIWQNAPAGETLPFVLTNSDGQTVESQCNAISQLALGAKVFCRAPSQNKTDNVDLIVAGDYPGGTKVKQKVTIDKDGVVLGLSQRMETGKNYLISLKMPKSLRKTVPVTIDDGTNTIPNFVLPVGDIFPIDSGDGTINALDKAELNRQWNISGDATGRSGDLNRDGRVNSVDWACMRYDFGKSDDKEPASPPAATPTPSPSPSVSVSPSPSVSVSPSPSPSVSPSPSPAV